MKTPAGNMSVSIRFAGSNIILTTEQQTKEKHRALRIKQLKLKLLNPAKSIIIRSNPLLPLSKMFVRLSGESVFFSSNKKNNARFHLGVPWILIKNIKRIGLRVYICGAVPSNAKSVNTAAVFRIVSGPRFFTPSPVKRKLMMKVDESYLQTVFGELVIFFQYRTAKQQ